jgi:hypothetical protein
VEVVDSAPGVDDSVGLKVVHDGVDGQVAPPSRFSDRHVGIALDRDPTVTRSNLAVASGNRHIDLFTTPSSGPTLVHPERSTNRIDSPELPQDGLEAFAREPKHLDIPVLHRTVEQMISDAATDRIRTPTGRGDGVTDLVYCVRD